MVDILVGKIVMSQGCEYVFDTIKLSRPAPVAGCIDTGVTYNTEEGLPSIPLIQPN